jgi:hypothetical protein
VAARVSVAAGAVEAAVAAAVAAGADAAAGSGGLENVLSDFIFCSFTASKKPFPRICNSIFSQSPKIAFFVNGAFSKKI